MKRMLINATQAEELRVALVDGQRLSDLDIEATGKEQKKSNIYKGRIIRLEPSLEAAFVDFGANRHGFLPLKEIARNYFKNPDSSRLHKANIKDLLKEGQELIVQVEKEERGNKGAALTTFLSLAGRYLVAMPNNPRAGGVSRQIEGDERTEAQKAMAGLVTPENMGIILRTAGVGKDTEELQWDLDYLNQVWTAIDDAAAQRQAPVLIFQDSNVIIRAIRDYLRTDILEILVDDKNLYQQAHEFMDQVMPHNLPKLKLYEDSVPLFNRYQIESQIETAFSRTIRLPSGGSLVIEPTEALTTVDINSARATQGSDIEETALRTNLEAAEEIGRQLRLRDLGGLLVIDFIDMLSNKNQRSVENRLRDSVKVDRARIQIGRISRFGLLEMSRQRLRPSLADSSYELCVYCDGIGSTRNVKSTALGVLRLIEEEAMKASTSTVYANTSIAVATFLVNEKRLEVGAIEERHNVKVILIPNDDLQASHFDVQREREQDTAKSQTSEGYRLHNDNEPNRDKKSPHNAKVAAEKPLVNSIKHEKRKPTPKRNRKQNLLARFFAALASIFSSNSKTKRSNQNSRGSTSARRTERSTRPSRKRVSNSDTRNTDHRPRPTSDDSSEQGNRINRGNDEKNNSNNKRRRRRPERETNAGIENIEKDNIKIETVENNLNAPYAIERPESSTPTEATPIVTEGDFSLTNDEKQRIGTTTQKNLTDKIHTNESENVQIYSNPDIVSKEQADEDPYLIPKMAVPEKRRPEVKIEVTEPIVNEPSEVNDADIAQNQAPHTTKVNYSYGSKPKPDVATGVIKKESVSDKSFKENVSAPTEEPALFHSEDDVDGNR